MSKTATQRIQELNQYYQKQNAEFLGTIVSLSVQMGEDVIPLQDIQDMVLNTPEIPGKWEPKPRNKLTMYLESVNQLKNSTSFEKFREFADEFPFDPGDHFGYLGKRIDYSRTEKIPAIHKIVHLRRSQTGAEIKGFEDLNVDTFDVDSEGITVAVERTSGTEETDHTTSKFAITFDPDAGDEYMPFIKALHKRFSQRLAQVYDSTAVRAVILDMIKGKMGAQSINTGTYLIDDGDAAQIDALRQGFSELHRHIDLFALHVVKYNDLPADHPANQNYQSVKKRLDDTIVTDLRDFVADIEARVESDTDTRRDTWTRRAIKLREYKKQVRKFKNKQLLISDSIESYLEEASKTLRGQLEASAA